MTKLKIHGWEKKPRTMLRFIKPGDVFLFRIEGNRYGMGRILTKMDLGHAAEIFSVVLDSPVVDEKLVNQARRNNAPVVLDSYSLFDRKLAGDWRIVAHQEGFKPSPEERTFFAYGTSNSWKKIDIFGNETSISNSEAETLPLYSPTEDWDIAEMFPFLAMDAGKVR